MRIAALFLWTLVPLSLWLGIAQYGTPHIVGSYSFYDNGAPYDPLAHRTYIDCTYYGWTGIRRVDALHGTCPWVRFFRSGS